MMKGFALLSKFRSLRGSALDIFGYSLERKQERADIVDYRNLLSSLVGGLNDGNYEVALELAGLAAKLRGFDFRATEALGSGSATSSHCVSRSLQGPF